MAFRRRITRRPLPPEEEVTVVEGGPPPGAPPPGPPLEPDRYWWPWLAVLLVALAVAGGLAAYFATRGDNDRVTMPAVVGLDEQTAVSRVERRGLKLRLDRRFSSREAGQVVSQVPGGGSQVKKGAVVVLVVSRGVQAVAVPNLIGLDEADAVAELTRAGLQAEVFQIPSSQRPGRVVAQNPDFGQQVEAGGTVRLNVSRGRTETTTVTTATTTVQTQTTTTGTTMTGTTTTGTTTTTPATTAVPDVTGLTLGDALLDLRGASVFGDSYPVGSEESGGTVVAQNPDGGASVDSGSVVRLNVSTGTTRPPQSVPDVRGRDQTAARQVLSRTFTVRAVYRAATSPSQVGNVVGELPTPGTRIKRWAQVVIYVGR